MNDFKYAIQSGFQNAFDFKGRAARHEYWYWTLFVILISVLLEVLGAATGLGLFTSISFIVSLALLIPGLSVSFRRLHDIDKSAWWFLITLIPFIGVVWFIYLAVQPSDDGHNRFGENPLDRKATAV